jgi:DnaJ like chaperone protein
MNYFNKGKSPNFNFEAIVDNFVRNCGYHPQLIQMFIEIQLQAAFVDGIANQYKRFVIEHLCDKLNIPRVVLAQMESRYHAEQTFHEPRRTPRDELSSAYTVLGVPNDSTQQVIKRAYKQLMSQNHPDKLVAKGLPAEMIRVATEKTQGIQKAYDIVCKARGFK